MVPFIHPANHAPWVQICHAPGASSAKISFTYLRTYSNILMTCWLSGERSLPFGLLVFKSAHLIITEINSCWCLNPMAFLMDLTLQEFKLKYPLLKLFEITISDHSSGVNSLHCHFMYNNLNSKSFVSRCKCVSCFDTTYAADRY